MFPGVANISVMSCLLSTVPKGKEKITGIEYESWHFRYVGRDAAQFITKNDLTLEEFLKIAKIQQKTGR